jgi:hypothetical protein
MLEQPFGSFRAINEKWRISDYLYDGVSLSINETRSNCLVDGELESRRQPTSQMNKF